MPDTVRKILALLTRREKTQLSGIAVATLMMGLLQIAGVGSIMPFVSLLTDAGGAEDNRFLNSIFETAGVTTDSDRLLFLGIGALCVIVLSNAFIALTIWLITRFAWGVQYRLSASLLEHYLSQPYTAFLGRNSADVGKNILYETQLLANNVMLPGLRVAAFGVSALAIVGFLIWFNPALAGLATAMVGGGYLVVVLAVRRTLLRVGRRRMAANTLRFKAVNEAFGGIKETKVLGREVSFIRQFVSPAERFARGMAISQVLGQVPRYWVETLAFGSILLVALFVVATGGAIGQIVPIVSVYAFAGYRLMPAMQQVYAGWSQARFNRVVVDTIHDDMVGIGANPGAWDRQGTARLPLEDALELRDVSLAYPGASEPALHGVSMTIPRGAFVAFIGTTGAGKTTLADVILGLLRPDSGEILVDGAPLEGERLARWQNNLGYVPQDIFLTDDTVAGNIAFGIPPDERDTEAVERASRVANIHDFITGELPHGYETVVGERGVRLSGGQRQRIGIARALYHDPEVLVLDEATSNLDAGTEEAVHRAIDQAAAAKTVIMIAHRLTTTRNCDTLYLLEHGRLVARGTYSEIAEPNGQIAQVTNTPTVNQA